MCMSFKKIWLWTAVNRKTKKLVGFFIGDRSSKSFERLYENTFRTLRLNFILQINFQHMILSMFIISLQVILTVILIIKTIKEIIK